MQKISPIMIFFIASLGAIPPFGIDTYLSSMPIIAEHFSTDLSQISITVSMFVFGMSLGQLIGGNLSDKLGRLPIILCGLSIFTIASIMLMIVDNIEFFWIWRIIQSLGGGMASICSAALIRDHSEGTQSAKLFSLVALIVMLAPAIAPSVGTLIIYFAPWQAIFAFLAFLAIFVACFALKMLSFGKPIHQTKNQDSKLIHILKNKRSMMYLALQCCSYGIIMIFLTNASFIYQKYFNLSEKHFSLLMSLPVIGVMVMNRLSSYLLKYFSPEKILAAFLSIQFCFALAFLSCTIFQPEKIIYITCLICTVACNGGIVPNTMALFMRDYAHCSGLAASLLFSSQSFVAASISALVAFLLVDSLLPLGIAFLIAVSLAVNNSFWAHKFNKNS